MNIYALPIIRIKQSMATICRQGVLFTAVVLLASSSARTQTSLSSLQPGQPPPKIKLVNANRVLEGERLTGYVSRTSSCDKRTGDKDCSSGGGPFRKVGEGVRGVSPGGTLFIGAGSYGEPIVLNKRMEIRAYGGSAIIAPSSLAPFDLVADTVDDNGLPLNPKWGVQRQDPRALPDPQLCPPGRDIKGGHDPGSYPCTNQFTYKNDAHICGPHVNWFAATYRGTVLWGTHSPDGEDDDYNIELQTDDHAGYTKATAENRIQIECEFDSDETIDNFSTPWWSEFHNAVDEGKPWTRAHKKIDGASLIVTGLVGLDGGHDLKSELHPVWALAMNVQDSADDSRWAFFVRNWGNEGFCGPAQEFIYFPNNRYTFRLPWKPGMTSVEVISKSFHAYHTTKPEPTIRPVPGEGVFVTFTLDAPRGDGSMWDGEFHLRWKTKL